MGFKKYSTVPLEVVGDDEQKPEWVKKAQKAQEEDEKATDTEEKEGE